MVSTAAVPSTWRGQADVVSGFMLLLHLSSTAFARESFCGYIWDICPQAARGTNKGESVTTAGEGGSITAFTLCSGRSFHLISCRRVSAAVQDIVFQLQRFVSTMSKYYDDCYAVLRDADVFPIEVDLARTTLSYGQKDTYTDGAEEEEEGGGSDREKSGKEDANGEKLIDDAWACWYGQRKRKTLQTDIKTCISHGDSSSVVFCVCPAWDSSSALGGSSWLDWDQPLPSSLFSCLFAWIFLFPPPLSLLLPNLDTELWEGKSPAMSPRDCAHCWACRIHFLPRGRQLNIWRWLQMEEPPPPALPLCYGKALAPALFCSPPWVLVSNFKLWPILSFISSFLEPIPWVIGQIFVGWSLLALCTIDFKK